MAKVYEEWEFYPCVGCPDEKRCHEGAEVCDFYLEREKVFAELSQSNKTAEGKFKKEVINMSLRRANG